MPGSETPSVTLVNPVVHLTQVRWTHGVFARVKTHCMHSQYRSLADRSGQNYEGFTTTVADEAKAYLLDASAEGNLVLYLRFLPTSARRNYSLASLLVFCAWWCSCWEAGASGNQRRLKPIGDSRRTTSFLATRAILVRCVHCLLLPPPIFFYDPYSPKTFEVCSLKPASDAYFSPSPV